MNHVTSLGLTLLLHASPIASPIAASGPGAPPLPELDAIYPKLDALYRDLHKNPELSLHEERTSLVLARELKLHGYDVTTRVGGTGVVAMMRNGAGPTLLIRTDMDGLPVEEKTGLPFASTATAKDPTGMTVHVMHACGHDIHMTSLVGAAALLAKKKTLWKGTLVLIGQPAEEVGKGARNMLADGLFTRFPKPDFGIALHDTDLFPSGKVGVTSGVSHANSDQLDVTIFGKGGHGARPHTAIDPIVIAARTILALQTIVSREMDPIDPAVVTVGSIHGGTKHNIIPDDVKLQLTVRSFKDEVRAHLHASIERIVKAEAAAAGAPVAPTIAMVESVPSNYNDPALMRRLSGALSSSLGTENVVEHPLIMGAEDFSLYGREGFPTVMLRIGAVEPRTFEEARVTSRKLPSLHSPLWAPDRERTIRTGVTTLVFSALELLRAGPR